MHTLVISSLDRDLARLVLGMHLRVLCCGSKELGDEVEALWVNFDCVSLAIMDSPLSVV
jgi:hypothetical protein